VPIGVPTDFKDKFLELKREVEVFLERLYSFFNIQAVELTPRATVLKGLIDGLEIKIAKYVFQ
jgi:hypothetical protein